jgi:transcriptional antiterminator
MTQYSKKELEKKVKSLYPQPEYEIMVSALIKAFRYLPTQDVDKLLNNSVIYIQGNISRRFNRDSICGRSLIILSEEDLRNERYCIPTILHESAHEILNHTDTYESKQYLQQEDEAWNKVREWLPKEFDELINELEKEGGGSKGQASKKGKK